MQRFVPLLLLAASASCQSEPQTTGEPAPAKSEPAEPVPEPAPELDAAALAPVLQSYERVRAGLAKDDAKVGPSASELADAVDSLTRSGAPGASDLAPLGEAARALSKSSTEDIDAARTGFASVSKALVEFLAKHPDLQVGLHVFECPMAPAYKKWVQPSDSLENPYMGTKMAGCGEKSDWAS